MPILGRGCRRFVPFALLAIFLGTAARADGLDARGRGDVTRLGPDGMRSALVAVARDGSTIWLGEGGSGASSVLVSTDGGRTFARSQAPACGVLDDLTTHPSDAASAWILCDNQLFVTEDRGAVWRRIVVVHPSVFRWLDLVVLPDASVFLHRQGGLFRLDPGGLVLVLTEDVLGADGGPDGSLWALTAAGLRRSRDRGASWTLVSSEPAQYGWIVVDPANSERVLVWIDRAKRLERSEDGGVSFQRIGPALEWLAPPRFGRGPILFTSSLVERGVGLGAGVSMVSRDLGRSWSPIPGLPSQSFGELAVDPLRPWHAIWAPGGATALGVWVSTDGYRSWVPRGAGLDGLTVSALAPSADRQSAWAVVAGVFGDRLYGFTAEGWRRAGLHKSPGSVASVAADAIAPGTAWAASSRGLLVTHDAGDSWEALSQSDTVWRAQLHAHPRVGEALFLIEQPIIYPIERLQRSTDGGLTFSDTGFDLDGAHRIVAPAGSPGR
ncbi:MAG TPA: hypothetical protein VJG13_12345, partial [Thermoanaerobaculia bacterium]|nr:hypothetical protein [Thermoanaerobaculia bacterium]